ncbi:hypothetical protein WA158_001003 [Blastocystis sp. Blastoise]
MEASYIRNCYLSSIHNRNDKALFFKSFLSCNDETCKNLLKSLSNQFAAMNNFVADCSQEEIDYFNQHLTPSLQSITRKYASEIQTSTTLLSPDDYQNLEYIDSVLDGSPLVLPCVRLLMFMETLPSSMPLTQSAYLNRINRNNLYYFIDLLKQRNDVVLAESKEVENILATIENQYLYDLVSSLLFIGLKFLPLPILIYFIFMSGMNSNTHIISFILTFFKYESKSILSKEYYKHIIQHFYTALADKRNQIDIMSIYYSITQNYTSKYSGINYKTCCDQDINNLCIFDILKIPTQFFLQNGNMYKLTPGDKEYYFYSSQVRQYIDNTFSSIPFCSERFDISKNECLSLLTTIDTSLSAVFNSYYHELAVNNKDYLVPFKCTEKTEESILFRIAYQVHNLTETLKATDLFLTCEKMWNTLYMRLFQSDQSLIRNIFPFRIFTVLLPYFKENIALRTCFRHLDPNNFNSMKQLFMNPEFEYVLVRAYIMLYTLDYECSQFRVSELFHFSKVNRNDYQLTSYTNSLKLLVTSKLSNPFLMKEMDDHFIGKYRTDYQTRQSRHYFPIIASKSELYHGIICKLEEIRSLLETRLDDYRESLSIQIASINDCIQSFKAKSCPETVENTSVYYPCLPYFDIPISIDKATSSYRNPTVRHPNYEQWRQYGQQRELNNNNSRRPPPESTMFLNEFHK